jgi:hypothetical protein
VTGNFTSVTYNGAVPAVLTHSTNGSVTSSNLDLAGTTTVIQPQTVAVVVPKTALVAPDDDSLFAAQNQAAGQLADSATAALLGKAAEGAQAGANAAACAAEAAVNPTNTSRGVPGTGQMAAVLGNAFCAAGGWLQATGSASDAAGAYGFNASAAGFLAGVDAQVTPLGTRLGLAVGYDDTWLHDRNGGKAGLETTRIGLYGSQPLGGFTLAGDMLLGLAQESSTRPSGIGALNGGTTGTAYNGGLQLDRAVTINGWRIDPAAGLRFAAIDAGGFAESSPQTLRAFAVNAAASAYTSVQPYLDVDISQSFPAGDAMTITPDLALGYAAELGDRGKAVTVTTQDGTAFATPHNAPDGNTASLSTGLAVTKNNLSLYAAYSANLSGNTTTQTAQAGLRISF